MRKTIRDIIGLLKDSARRFPDNDPFMMAGALAFFTVFAIPPVLIIIIFLISLFVGQAAAATAIFDQIDRLIGAESATVLQEIVNHYFSGSPNILQWLLRIGIFIFASSSFFLIIQHAINQIWNVKPKPQQNILNVLKNRVLSFGIIVGFGLILILSLASRSAVFSLQDNFTPSLPFFTPILSTIVSILLSFMVGVLGFGVIYKFLPDVIIEWKVVWVGAAVTSFLFILGRFLIGFALRGSNVQLMYGTAGSMAIFLLWVFYSSIIVIFGAQVTQQYARSFAETIQPKEHAVKFKTTEVGNN